MLDISLRHHRNMSCHALRWWYTVYTEKLSMQATVIKPKSSKFHLNRTFLEKKIKRHIASIPIADILPKSQYRFSRAPGLVYISHTILYLKLKKKMDWVDFSSIRVTVSLMTEMFDICSGRFTDFEECDAAVLLKSVWDSYYDQYQIKEYKNVNRWRDVQSLCKAGGEVEQKHSIRGRGLQWILYYCDC